MFDLDQFVEDLRTFVGFKTCVSQNRTEFDDAIEWIQGFFDPATVDFLLYEHKGYKSLIIRPQGSARPRVLGDGHIEVVPANNEMFTLKEKDGQLLGRGVGDMKTQCLMMVYALREMIATGDHHDFWLLFTEDEEIGAENGVRQMIEYLCSNNLAPDVVFIPDGGPDFAYVEKEKGILKFMAHTTGRAAHGSRPFLGDNAVDKMWAFYEDLRQEYPNPINEADWRPSIAMTLINAGQTLNKIPDACDAGFDMRFTEDHELIVVQTEIEIVAANYDAVIDVASFGMATYFPKEHPIAERFIDILRRASGKEPDILHSNGASTARVYMEYKPDIVVLMSNPTMGGSHSESECVLKSSLEPYYQVVLETAQLDSGDILTDER